MGIQHKTFVISGTSPAAASTALGTVIGGLLQWDWFTVTGLLLGGTGGTLDVYLQRQVALDEEVTGGVWVDWLHFPQLADGAAAIRYCCDSAASTSITAVGIGTDASAGTPALAVNTFLGGHPGTKVRAVYKAGVGASAGAAQTIYLTCWKRDS